MLKKTLQGRFIKHPLHPIFVHLPIGIWLAAWIFDLIYFGTRNPAFGTASFYAIGIGILGALLAAGTGIVELWSIPVHTHARKIALTHMSLNIVVVLMFTVGFFLRRGLIEQGQHGVSTLAFVVSTLALGVLSFSGYLGGLLVYDYGIGFKPQNRDQKKPHLRRIA